MKNICFVLVLLFGCTSTAQKEQTEVVDSTSTIPVQEAAVTESAESEGTDDASYEEEAEPVYDSVYSTEPIDLDNFAQYPLGDNSYDSIIASLVKSNIEYEQQNLDGVQYITFKRSSIRVLIAEAYGDLICSANINCTCYELGEGVKIGMPLDNFLSRTNLTRDSLEGGSRMYYTRTAGGTHVGGTSTVTLTFEDERLVEVEYGFDPCMIYD